MKIIAACPICGNTTWTEKDDGFECLACEEFSYPEDMTLVVDDDLGTASKTPYSPEIHAPDSEAIARLLDGFEYHPEKKDEVLEKYSRMRD